MPFLDKLRSVYPPTSIHNVSKFIGILAKLTVLLTMLWVVLLLPDALYHQHTVHSPALTISKKAENQQNTADVARITTYLAAMSVIMSLACAGVYGLEMLIGSRKTKTTKDVDVYVGY
jgi:hypothetical protein